VTYIHKTLNIHWIDFYLIDNVLYKYDVMEFVIIYVNIDPINLHDEQSSAYIHHAHTIHMWYAFYVVKVLDMYVEVEVVFDPFFEYFWKIKKKVNK
jgi:hypothetical protein